MSTPPKYLPEAIPTTIGWAHPLTGEQLDCTTGLEDPVAYYHPNDKSGAFIDPEGEERALIQAIRMGTSNSYKFAVQSHEKIESVTWSYGDGSESVLGGPMTRHVFPGDYKRTVTAVVKFVDSESADLSLTIVVFPEGDEPPSIPVNLTVPVIDAAVGENVEHTTTDGTWDVTEGVTFSYKWFLNDVEVEGETTNKYTGGVENDRIAVEVTATNSAGSSAPARSVDFVVTV